MAITSLISNKHEWNNCFIKFLKLQNLKYEIRAKKAGKSERNRKKFDEDVMLCNTLWSDRRRPRDHQGERVNPPYRPSN